MKSLHRFLVTDMPVSHVYLLLMFIVCLNAGLFLVVSKYRVEARECAASLATPTQGESE